MAIDASIYQNLQGPNILGAVQQGLSMRDMIDQRAQRQKEVAESDSIKKAFASNVVTNPDGTTTLDRQKTLGEIMKINPLKGFELKQQFTQMDQAEQKAKQDRFNFEIEQVAREGMGIKDQATYDASLGRLSKAGIDVSQMPRQYDKNLVDGYVSRALTAKERMDHDLKKRELDIKDRGERAKANGGEGLSIDKKKIVETLATKNANKIAIRNQIDAVMNGWDGLSDDQKLKQGQQLLKTLNSTEGADAIGVEEANRLGSMLEFAYGNLSNGNPTQFGRDLKGFAKQARLTASNIGKAVESNQQEIDRTMGRTAAQKEPGGETKVWEGVTYKRVGDQWVAQK